MDHNGQIDLDRRVIELSAEVHRLREGLELISLLTDHEASRGFAQQIAHGVLASS